MNYCRALSKTTGVKCKAQIGDLEVVCRYHGGNAASSKRGVKRRIAKEKAVRDIDPSYVLAVTVQPLLQFLFTDEAMKARVYRWCQVQADAVLGNPIKLKEQQQSLADAVAGNPLPGRKEWRHVDLAQFTVVKPE